MSVLSVFNVTKARDENGREIPVSAAVRSDAIVWCVDLAAVISTLHSIDLHSHPVKFTCSITPRDKVAKDLITDDVIV